MLSSQVQCYLMDWPESSGLCECCDGGCERMIRDDGCYSLPPQHQLVPRHPPLLLNPPISQTSSSRFPYTETKIATYAASLLHKQNSFSGGSSASARPADVSIRNELDISLTHPFFLTPSPFPISRSTKERGNQNLFRTLLPKGTTGLQAATRHDRVWLCHHV